MPTFTRLAPEDRRRSLIDAAIACMEKDGIAGFTIDRICGRAKVSRGLITHHFGGIAGLMAATYARLYDEDIPPDQPLDPLLDAIFDPARFNRPRLNAWLALWQAIANSPQLTAEHRSRYALYHAHLARALADQGLPADLAAPLIALIDGLSLQHCIDAEALPAATARATCAAFLAAQRRAGTPD